MKMDVHTDEELMIRDCYGWSEWPLPVVLSNYNIDGETVGCVSSWISKTSDKQTHSLTHCTSVRSTPVITTIFHTKPTVRVIWIFRSQTLKLSNLTHFTLQVAGFRASLKHITSTLFSLQYSTFFLFPRKFTASLPVRLSVCSLYPPAGGSGERNFHKIPRKCRNLTEGNFATITTVQMINAPVVIATMTVTFSVSKLAMRAFWSAALRSCGEGSNCGFESRSGHAWVLLLFIEISKSLSQKFMSVFQN